MTGPAVSVVIVHLGSTALLRDCLATLHATTHGVRFETVVVDNVSGAQDLEAVLAPYPDARLVRLAERRGYAGAANAGIAESRGRYVLWCNNDLLFQEGAVETLAHFLDVEPTYGVASPRLLNPDGTFQPCFSLLDLAPTPLVLERMGAGRLLPGLDLHRHWRGHERAPRDVAVAAGACCLIRRSALDAIGGLDAAFFLYAEEFDLCRRVRDAGWRVRYLPDAVVVHVGSQTTVRAPDAVTYRFVVQAWRSHFAYLRKHHGAAAEGTFAAVFAATAVPRWLAARVRGGVAALRGDADGARLARERARLHAYSLRMALGAERHEAARLVTYPPVHPKA
ncbi:MAG TPA: glycosyltransferase family 2 protein [Gemmatirosa sp.]|nr:glycosyltransferase family 2 protein [Gemmatirosa sp.]